MRTRRLKPKAGGLKQLHNTRKFATTKWFKEKKQKADCKSVGAYRGINAPGA